MKLIFDVESNGLHGEGFAVGWIAVNERWEAIEEGIEIAPLHTCSGDPDQWVLDNVVKVLPPPTQKNPRGVRDAFWRAYQTLKKEAEPDSGFEIWADCLWPVEARFLRDCITDDLRFRRWEGPYPFHEIATILRAKGLDPIGHFDRIEGETVHNPLGDARQSARILRQCHE